MDPTRLSGLVIDDRGARPLPCPPLRLHGPGHPGERTRRASSTAAGSTPATSRKCANREILSQGAWRGGPSSSPGDGTDKVRVLLNTCTHRGATICREPKGNAKVHRCYLPRLELHGRGASCTGSPTRPPTARRSTGGRWGCWSRRAERPFIATSSSSTSTRPTTFPSRTTSGTPRTTSTWLPISRRAAWWSLSGTQSYSARANYKLLVENSIDAYHVVPTHKRYLDWLMDANAMDRMEAALAARR